MKQRSSGDTLAGGVTPPPHKRLHRPRVNSATHSRISVRFALAIACLLVPALAAPSVAQAQKKGDRVRVLAGTALRTAPGGQVVGVLSRVYEAPVELVQGSAVRLRLNGFVNESDVRLQSGGSRGVMGAASGREENGGALRTGRGEKEPVLATLQRGAVVFPGEKSASFVAVNRVVWVDKSRLAKFTGPPVARPVARAAANQPAAPQQPAPRPAAPPATAQTPVAAVPVNNPQSLAQKPAAQAAPLMQTAAVSPLRSGPNGSALLSLPAGTVVTPLNSANGWTRVRVDGWVATAELADLDAKGASGISAADLRADPEGMKGRMVRWTVENLSYQLADGLRRELNGEPYLLARGPGNERAILYLAVPDSLVDRARALAPLSTIDILARVRSGRSQPGGVPILDLVELLRR